MTAYDGDCVITRFDDPTDLSGGYKLRIDRADKYIRIAPELLAEVERANHPNSTIADGLFRIVGVNRTVIYRVGELVHDQYAHPWYQAERVDEE